MSGDEDMPNTPKSYGRYVQFYLAYLPMYWSSPNSWSIFKSVFEIYSVPVVRFFFHRNGNSSQVDENFSWKIQKNDFKYFGIIKIVATLHSRIFVLACENSCSGINRTIWQIWKYIFRMLCVTVWLMQIFNSLVNSITSNCPTVTPLFIFAVVHFFFISIRYFFTREIQTDFVSLYFWKCGNESRRHFVLLQWLKICIYCAMTEGWHCSSTALYHFVFEWFVDLWRNRDFAMLSLGSKI